MVDLVGNPLHYAPKAATMSNPATTAKTDAVRAKAEELEGVFLNTLVSQMFNSLDARNEFGGGYAEETWRSMQAEQYANLISQNGGIGLADQIVADLLQRQEAAGSQSSYTPSQSGAYQP